MADIQFADLPYGTGLRLAAVAVLKSVVTMVDSRVFDSRLDPVGVDDMPAIVVTHSESRSTLAAAGGPAAFRVAYTLRLQGIVIAAAESDAVLAADLLRRQMLDGLLEDPIWPGLVEAIESDDDTGWVGRTDARFERQTIVTISTAYRETYSPRLDSVLLPGGGPSTWHPVIAPLTAIRNTVAISNGGTFATTVPVPQDQG